MTPLCKRICPFPYFEATSRAPPPDPRLKPGPVFVASGGLTKPNKLTPDVDIPNRSPRTGVSTVPGVRGLGVEEVAVLEVRIVVATRTRGAGGGRLQASKLGAAIQDEVAPGEIGRMNLHVAGP